MNDNQTIPVLTSLALPDGALIERLSESKLAVWRDGNIIVGTEIQAEQCRYVAGELNGDLSAALKFPSAVDDDANLSQLLVDLELLLTNEAGFPADQAVLLIAAVLGTWVPDFLAKPVWLHFWGPESDAGVMPLLAALVRQPLLLGDVSARELAQVPAGLAQHYAACGVPDRCVDEIAQNLRVEQAQDHPCQQQRSRPGGLPQVGFEIA